MTGALSPFYALRAWLNPSPLGALPSTSVGGGLDLSPSKRMEDAGSGGLLLVVRGVGVDLSPSKRAGDAGS